MADPNAVTSVKKNTSSYRRHQRNIAKDIQHQQTRSSLILPRTSFSRLVHEIVSEIGDGDYYVRQDAVKALQCVSEDYISEIFKETNRLATYNNRETITAGDMNFVCGSADERDSSEAELEHLPTVPVL